MPGSLRDELRVPQGETLARTILRDLARER